MKTLGFRTDLFFARINGLVSEHDGYTVVRTPSNPTYWWGNCVIFHRAPRLQDAVPWLETFRREHPSAKHIAIGWDEAAPGDTLAFSDLEPGLELVESSVLTARALREPKRRITDAELRPLQSDADWDARLALTIAVKDWGFEYLSRDNLARRRQAETGRGAWFGAFVNGTLVSSLGVFNTGDGLGRFQTVETHPEFERRGLASALVHHAGNYALEHLGVRELVIVADPEYHAQRLYESLGFAVAERQYTLERPGSSD